MRSGSPTSNNVRPWKEKDDSSSDEVPFVVSGSKMNKSEVKVREIWIGNLPETVQYH